MQEEKKQFVIGKEKFVLRDISVAHYRKLYKFINKHSLKNFYSIEEDTKVKIEVEKIISTLVMSNLLDGFLEMILEPLNKSRIFKLKCFVKKLFGKSIYENISDEMLIEVVAVFFSGKLQLLKGLTDAFLKFSQNIKLPLTQLEQFQV